MRRHSQVENVKVEESFSFLGNNNDEGNDTTGDGVYVSALTTTNKRYYGVLVDQSALKGASDLWFKDQADSLELNRRMKVLMEQKKSKEQTTSVENGGEEIQQDEADNKNDNNNNKRQAPLETTEEEGPKKRIKTEEGPAPTKDIPTPDEEEQPVQKFRYVRGGNTDSTKDDYRVLVATFCSIKEAAGGDPTKVKEITAACEGGGNFVLEPHTQKQYYYQYEVLPAALQSESSKQSVLKYNDNFEMRTSMGFHSFLRDTTLPPWFPLTNLEGGSKKVLSMLNMKRDSSGNMVWDAQQEANHSLNEASLMAAGTRLPMQPRPKHAYEIGVIGGGIAGLACCQELVTVLRNENIQARVTLMEARDRFGGRLWTDKTMASDNGQPIPIELGAQWIHGIDDNPLAALSREAKCDFITASEEVTMLGADGERIDAKMDDNMGKLFDDLLDHAAEDCWGLKEGKEGGASRQNSQAAVKWYSSVFANKPKEGEDGTKILPELVGVPLHRKSSDRSVDFEIGQAIAKHKLRQFSKLGVAEQRMLMWNTKNVEYALGANISDLSMKYWDSDERHAFEGDHVLLKQGYSSVIQYMLETLQKAGSERFHHELNFPVGKVEYARKSQSKHYSRDPSGRKRRFVDLSDTCSVTSQDGKATKYFDFLVSAVPLGVLKESIQGTLSKEDEKPAAKLSFQPPLPFSKTDAITNVGFGLLDKVFLHFPTAFWREKGIFFEDDQCLFGNCSGKNPHHYMFFDVGKCVGSNGEKSSAILMSLISGKEAVACESLSDKELIAETMETLQTIFPQTPLPEPTAFRITRWGKDPYSRGSYTYLPPGATDQDFQLLQSPINGNGDSLWTEGNETMRLFFAGEHTTSLHPSMAHGAMLSGIRAAKEIVSTLQFKHSTDKDIDRIIPEPLFRHKNPTIPLRCSLCHKFGGQIREGRLVAFKRGARQVLVHNNCAENSPEVEVADSQWKNVIKAVNRGKAMNCTVCGSNGATIGCTFHNCYRVYHFSCCEDTGWRFDRDGKVFYCDLHRKASPFLRNENDRISLQFYRSKHPGSDVSCSFCHSKEDNGTMFAYQQGTKQICVHEKCIKYTNIIDTSEVENSRMGHEYRNIFRALQMSKTCMKCNLPGATVVCTDPSCGYCLHVTCCQKSGWNFEKQGKRYLCQMHREKASTDKKSLEAPTKDQKSSGDKEGSVQHNLLSLFGASQVRYTMPSNEGMGGSAAPDSREIMRKESVDDNSDSSIGDDSSAESLGQNLIDVLLTKETDHPIEATVSVERSSEKEKWNLSLAVEKVEDSNYLIVAASKSNDASIGLRKDDVILSINDATIGSDLKSLRNVLTLLEKETSLKVLVARKK